MPSKSGLYVGLMSGTSLDGIDGVLVDFSAEGPSRLRVLHHAYLPFPEPLRNELLALNSPGGENELQRAALASNGVARSYAATISRLLSDAGIGPDVVTAAGAHGQTVRHRPGEFDGSGFTIQLLNAGLLAELSGMDIVADLRSRDVAAGGQGAPLVPAFHRAVFGQAGRDTAVLNLGGIANLTLLEADGTTRGFDCGPANALMDHWAEQHLGVSYDADGAWAASGLVDERLLHSLLSEPYFALPPPKSTGRDLFHKAWLDQHLAAASATGRLAPAHVQATLLELTAQSSVFALRQQLPQASELLVCGGGARNGALMARIAALLPSVPVKATDDAGLPASQVEATAFAWLAHAFMQREPGNVTTVTGARGPRVLGALYPR